MEYLVLLTFDIKDHVPGDSEKFKKALSIYGFSDKIFLEETWYKLPTTTTLILKRNEGSIAQLDDYIWSALRDSIEITRLQVEYVYTINDKVHIKMHPEKKSGILDILNL